MTLNIPSDFSWKTLLECDSITGNDCPMPDYSNCKKMLRPTSSGKRQIHEIKWPTQEAGPRGWEACLI